jgi:DNA mismatch endonuclease (patch repair protein)
MTKTRLKTDAATSLRMQRIKTAKTEPERRVERILRRESILFRRNFRLLPGTPDFVLVKRGVAVFVDGCFWHGCPRCFAGTRRNRSWWAAKIESNRRRDKRVNALLRRRGYRVLHLWEHYSDQQMERRLMKMISGSS